MPSHADPQAGPRRATVVSDASELERLQRQSDMWEDKQAHYAGAEGTVELEYPNGDMAVSFPDGQWLRLQKGAVTSTSAGGEDQPAGSSLAVLAAAGDGSHTSLLSTAAAAADAAAAAADARPTPTSHPAENVLTMCLPLPNADAPLGITFALNTGVISGVDVSNTASVFYPVRLEVQVGFTILDIDGVRMRTPADVRQAITVAAKVRGQCTVKILDGAETSAVAAAAAAAAAPSHTPGSRPALVGRSSIGKTLEEAEAALSSARANLKSLRDAVEAQEQEVAGIEEIVAIRRRTQKAMEKTRDLAAEEPAADGRLRTTPLQVLGEDDEGDDDEPEDGDASKAGGAEEKEKEKKKKKKKGGRREVEIVKDVESKAELLEVYEKMHHAKRRDGVDKSLAAMGNPELEDLEFWDLRGSQDNIQCGEDQIPVEIFYFGEMEEAGDPNTFKVHVIDRLRRAGVTGVVAPYPMKEAGCMYPLIGIPMVLPWREALKLGNVVFEEFGIPQGNPDQQHGEKVEGNKGGAGGDGGCASQ